MRAQRRHAQLLNEGRQGERHHHIGDRGRQPHAKQERHHHGAQKQHHLDVREDSHQRHAEPSGEVGGQDHLTERPDGNQQQGEQGDEHQAILDGDQERLQLRSVTALKEAEQEGGGGAHQASERWRAVVEQEHQDHEEGAEKRRQHTQNELAVGLGLQPGQLEAAGVDQDADGHAAQKQQPRYQRSQGDIDVGHIEEGRDDEAGQAQDRRHDLARGGGDRLDRAGHARAVTVLLHHGNGEATRQHHVGNSLAHDRGHDSAAHDGGKGSAALDITAADLADLDHHLEHAQPEQDGGVEEQEIDAVGRHLGQPEEALIGAEAHVVHHEVGVVLRMGEQHVLDQVAVEEIDDGGDHHGGQKWPPMDPGEDQYARRQHQSHLDIERLEEGLDHLEAHGVHPDESGARGGQDRTQRRGPRARPKACIRRPAALPVDHVAQSQQPGHEYDGQNESGVMLRGVTDQAEDVQADVERQDGARHPERNAERKSDRFPGSLHRPAAEGGPAERLRGPGRHGLRMKSPAQGARSAPGMR